MGDKEFMKIAIEEAKNSDGYPKVGAVIICKEKVISKGHTEMIKEGLFAHAEENAINSLSNVSGDALYVTLEPCFYRSSSHKTCCDLILNSGIKKVVIGLKDFNIKNNGNSIKKLKERGLEVLIFDKSMERELLELLGGEYICKHREVHHNNS